MSVTAFQPITKNQAADILGVSIRSIENYVSEGIMPAPKSIGRRVFWHPEEFYGWLNAQLRTPENGGHTSLSSALGACPPKSQQARTTKKMPKTASSSSISERSTRTVNKSRAKRAAFLEKINCQ